MMFLYSICQLSLIQQMNTDRRLNFPPPPPMSVEPDDNRVFSSTLFKLASGRMDEPLPEGKDAEKRSSTEEELEQMKQIQLELDAIFGSLDEPLADCEDLPDQVNLRVSDSEPKKRRRGRGRNPQNLSRGVQNRSRVLVLLAQRKNNTQISDRFFFLQASHESSVVRRRFEQGYEAPSESTVWGEADIPRRFVSADGFDLLYHFPGGVSPKATTELTDLLINYGRTLNIQVSATADRFHQNKPNSYIRRPGEVAGVVHLVRAWHGMGSTDLSMVPSRDFLKSGPAFCQSVELLDHLRVFSAGINAFLRVMDPTQYRSLREAQKEGHKKYPYLRMVDSVDPLLMEGRAVMWNRTTSDHQDIGDPKVAWAALVVLGKIRSGWLIFRQLNLKVRYQPGDVVWLRGAILDHEVDVWEGEQRICVAHFTHQSYFNDLGVVCSTAPGVEPTDPPPPTNSATSNRKRKKSGTPPVPPSPGAPAFNPHKKRWFRGSSFPSTVPNI
ncbi:hypothetical protein D9757_013787 [Collybiopsis confluens]|uniref:Uncharacterized protein n=1 Tax=Collybiopsis confluens TaxID=2823264 RepID=A0A8H5CPE3_9AGAR|nr:hypothetical protein D9757_013787 [Collybiopsis confluens]